MLMLSAPKIAGLLAARVPSSEPAPTVFTFSDPRFDRLSDEQRLALFEAMTTLFEVGLGHALDEMNEAALNAALTLVRRAVTGQRMPPRNPAMYTAESDADLLDWLVSASRRQAIREQEIRREIELRWPRTPFSRERQS